LKLISIHLPSNKPFHFRRLIENLVATAADPKCFEIVVKIDVGDNLMIDTVKKIQQDFSINLVPLITERFPSYFHTYIAYKETLKASDPDYYFCWHINDEILLETQNWDTKLAKYVGLFPDDIFRLKVNPQKMFRNFFEISEICLYADYPIVPRKWLVATEVWAHCHGPDIYQEGVSIYLAKYGFHRNVPLLDIKVGGDEAGKNMSPEKALVRAQGTCLAWDYALSTEMQEIYARSARRLQLFIMAHELQLNSWELRDERDQRAVILVEDEHVYARVFYGLDYVGITLANFRYIAMRSWPYSLWGKSAALKVALKIYYFISTTLYLFASLAKLPLGIIMGFPMRALLAGLLNNNSTANSIYLWGSNALSNLSERVVRFLLRKP
jgi:hypothetical protein